MIKEIKRAKVNEPPTVEAASIPPGQTFTGQIGTYSDNLFIKVYDSIVSLDDPEDGLWSYSGNLKIHNYKPVDIKIEVIEQ